MAASTSGTSVAKRNHPIYVWHARQVVIVFEGHAELFLEVHALPKLVGALTVDGKGDGLVIGLFWGERGDRE